MGYDASAVLVYGIPIHSTVQDQKLAWTARDDALILSLIRVFVPDFGSDAWVRAAYGDNIGPDEDLDDYRADNFFESLDSGISVAHPELRDASIPELRDSTNPVRSASASDDDVPIPGTPYVIRWWHNMDNFSGCFIVLRAAEIGVVRTADPTKRVAAPTREEEQDFIAFLTVRLRGHECAARIAEYAPYLLISGG